MIIIVWVRVPLLAKLFFMKKGLHPKRIQLYVRDYKGSVIIFQNHFKNYDFLLNLKNLIKDKKEKN